MRFKFTPSEWEKILGFEVIDPDGWDRSGDFQADWAKPLTFTEFLDKADDSTCGSHPTWDECKKLAVAYFEANLEK